jgi:uncharacterized protein (TIGR02271 family)
VAGADSPEQRRATGGAREAPGEEGGGEAQADAPSTLAACVTSPHLREARRSFDQGDTMAALEKVTQGMKVRSSDGASLGKIIRVEPGFIVVEKGFFFPKDYEIATSYLTDVRDDECWLSLSREELERQGQGEGTYGQGEGAYASGAERRAEESAGYAEPSRAGTEGRHEGEQRMQLSEEELEARKRVREAGDVTVRKEVVTERRQIDVPVTREEVHVERVPATASGEAAGAFEEKEIRMPVHEEEVEVTKRPRVREEVRVSKTARQE